MTIDELIPSLLNTLVSSRVWQNATPDDLPRDANRQIRDFIIWTHPGGQDSEYVDQTAPEFTNVRLQIEAASVDAIRASLLIKSVRDRLLASDYTVGVYGSPVGNYDAARKLHVKMQQFGIWFRQ